MASDVNTRFSDEELAQCQSWLLPDVSSAQLIPSAEKEAKEKQLAENRISESVKQQPDEIIEIADAIVEPPTAEQLQAITEAAEKEGYENGYQKGLEQGTKEGFTQGESQGLAQGKETIQQQCERLQHLLEALLIPLQSEQKELQSVMLDMVCQLAKAVIQRELRLDSSQIVELIDTALNTIPASVEKFTLYLNSTDVELVEAHLHSNLSSVDKQFIYHIDDQLLPGGCRLETQQSVVDFSVEKRMEKIIDGFLHKRFVNSYESEEATTSHIDPDSDDVHVPVATDSVSKDQVEMPQVDAATTDETKPPPPPEQP